MLYVCVIQTGRERRVGTHRMSWPTAFPFIAVMKRSVFFFFFFRKRDRVGVNGEFLMKKHQCLFYDNYVSSYPVLLIFVNVVFFWSLFPRKNKTIVTFLTKENKQLHVIYWIVPRPAAF
jgi:hypothetical protein